MKARYLIGVDLGTSNSALAYLDTLEEGEQSNTLPLTQLSSPGSLEERTVLPSFLYVGSETESASAALHSELSEEASPRTVVGTYALAQTAYQPDRVISSAKSWLCHGGVDREAKILPWGSEAVSAEERLSPLEVSAAYLRHLLLVWNRSIGRYHSEYRFESQAITLCVPASFDEAAQRLTLVAARLAGYPEELQLLEEPQAAFYRWLEEHSLEESIFRAAPELRERAVRVLVCDVGGGTSDFSLFEIQHRGDELPDIERISVSDHILLGGDNIDFAIAKKLEGELPNRGGKLSPRQWNQLVFAATGLKERVLGAELGADPEEEFRVAVPGEGSSLFATSLSASITRRELMRLIVEDFFPKCEANVKLNNDEATVKEWGLPFASDCAVTRHLADFLSGRPVDAVLYNGGSLTPEFLRSRLQGCIAEWQHGAVPIQLRNSEMELAVARGAAFFGEVLRSNKGKIGGGYPRSIYIELHTDLGSDAKHLVCILPQGAAEDTPIALTEQRFKLLLGEPARFQLYHSTHRGYDAAGDIVELNDTDFHALPDLQTAFARDSIATGTKDGLVDVYLETVVNQLGLLQIHCVHADAGASERWHLEFNLRSAADEEPVVEEENSSIVELEVEDSVLQKALQRIASFYGKGGKSASKESPKKLTQDLEEILGLKRDSWSTQLCRAIWPALEKGITRRGRSRAHETSWLYLAGFILRPGYGAELDDWRMDALWRLIELGLANPKEQSSVVQWWIMWRRVAGGLDIAKQRQLYKRAMKEAGKKGGDIPELYRLLGSLERIEVEEKIALGDMIVKRLSGRKVNRIEAYIWAFGRLASRVPLYASAHRVVPPEQIEKWYHRLAELDWRQGDLSQLNAAMSQVLRQTGDRVRDVSEEVRREALQKMQQSGASTVQQEVVRDLVAIDIADQVRLFGEELPSGLRLVRDE